MSRKGFILIEVLIAAGLIAIVGGSLYMGFMQAVKIDKTIREVSALNNPFKLFWMEAGKDLRNTVSLREEKFIGSQDEITFPVLKSPYQLLRVHYVVKDGKLIRSEENLPEKFVKDNPGQKILINDIECIRFQYAYLDEEEQLVYQTFWTEEPYFGIPRAIKIDIKLLNREKTFTRLIPIPQGQWGHMAEAGTK
jgi:hypothetical protein